MTIEHSNIHPRPVNPQEPTEPNIEETSEKFKEYYLGALEDPLKKEIDQRAPRLPEHEQAMIPIQDANGDPVAMIERFRKPEENKFAGRDFGYDLWLIVDFDDVLYHSTTFFKDIYQTIHDQAGIPMETLETMYEAAKVPNKAGKKVLRISAFIDQVKAQAGDIMDVDAILRDIDYQQYIDSAVKHALIGARLQRGRAVRVSILTYGDPDFQKSKIHHTDVSDIVDEVIYTEGSKREVVEALLNEVRQQNRPYPGAVPFVITVDDSPDHVDDYDALSLDCRYADVRFHHPQAKRFDKPHKTSSVIVHEETADNTAAWNLYQMARLATHQYAQEYGNEVFRIFNNPEYYDDKLSRWGGYSRSEGVHYQREGDYLIRKGRLYHFNEAWDKGRNFSREVGRFTPDGSFEINPVHSEAVDFREWILG